jgi:hypothetical protein
MTLRSVFCCLLAAPSLALLVDSSPALAQQSSKVVAADEANQVELFQAIQDGEVEVKFIARDAKQANLFIKNKTKRPLVIKLPEAFAGVPVLAQVNNNNNFGAGNNNQFGGGGANAFQGLGGGLGGFGGGGLGGLGGFGGGGFFNVPADKVGKLQVACVCLEHGKKDPNPRIQYELKPIESFTDNGNVIELCKMLGRGEINQNSAQAAVWHVANGLSWQELAHKDRVRLSNGYTEKYFSPQQLGLAVRAAAEAQRRAEKEAQTTVGSKADSLSKS